MTKNRYSLSNTDNEVFGNRRLPQFLGSEENQHYAENPEMYGYPVRNIYDAIRVNGERRGYLQPPLRTNRHLPNPYNFDPNDGALLEANENIPKEEDFAIDQLDVNQSDGAIHATETGNDQLWFPECGDGSKSNVKLRHTRPSNSSPRPNASDLDLFNEFLDNYELNKYKCMSKSTRMFAVSSKLGGNIFNTIIYSRDVSEIDDNPRYCRRTSTNSDLCLNKNEKKSTEIPNDSPVKSYSKAYYKDSPLSPCSILISKEKHRHSAVIEDVERKPNCVQRKRSFWYRCRSRIARVFVKKGTKHSEEILDEKQEVREYSMVRRYGNGTILPFPDCQLPTKQAPPKYSLKNIGASENGLPINRRMVCDEAKVIPCIPSRPSAVQDSTLHPTEGIVQADIHNTQHNGAVKAELGFSQIITSIGSETMNSDNVDIGQKEDSVIEPTTNPPHRVIEPSKKRVSYLDIPKLKALLAEMEADEDNSSAGMINTDLVDSNNEDLSNSIALS